MALPKPEEGLVISYAYLWLHEFRVGREEGVKARPCAIIASIRNDGDGKQRVRVVPITHLPPADLSVAIEIPQRVKQHLGLDDERSWVMLNESNEFTWPGPDLRKIASHSDERFDYGFLPPRFFENIRQAFLKLDKSRQAIRIKRTE